MAVNHFRSQRDSLLYGTTDGKYRKRRPDTEVQPMAGDKETADSRGHLHPPMNYGFINEEVPAKGQISPGV